VKLTLLFISNVSIYRNSIHYTIFFVGFFTDLLDYFHDFDSVYNVMVKSFSVRFLYSPLHFSLKE